jgi:gamma-glutamyltranspeptidase / glutathione hydrolase
MTILNVVDFGMNAQEAVDAGRIHHQWLPDRISMERFGFSAGRGEDPAGHGPHRLEATRAAGDPPGDNAEVIVFNQKDNELLEGGRRPAGAATAVPHARGPLQAHQPRAR